MKEARQARSRETQIKLIQAAEQILKESGSQNFKVEALTAKAGCSTGSFYNLFKDRNAVIVAVMDSIKKRTQDDIRSLFEAGAFNNPTKDEILALMVDFSKNVYHENGSIFRICQSLSDSIPELRCVGNEMVELTVSVLAQLPSMSDVDKADLQFLTRTIIATFDHYLFFLEEGQMPSEKLRNQLLHLMCGYFK
ncbi:MAG: TetR/AcrR family transcriptional regulator [Pseudobacteriovorax sp.]|nr:TetR/AcrR family transcriptional regulator [Pseudobacteriovorax sp.]